VARNKQTTMKPI